MKLPHVILALALAASSTVYAEKSAKEPHEPTAKQQAQRERMKSCNAEAGDRKGDERRKFMSTCLKKS